MVDTAPADLVMEFDMVSEELLELLDAGLPKGKSPTDDENSEGWDSKQIVAHMAELCEYWRLSTEEGLRQGTRKVMGRSDSDEERLSRINSLSQLPTGKLIERLTMEVGKAAGLLAALEIAELDVSVLHLRDGHIKLSDLCARHLIAHMCEHLAQLKELEHL